MVRKNKSERQGEAYRNAYYKDEELRAVRFPKMYKELKRSQILGLENMSTLARLTKKQLLTSGRSVEKISILDDHLDAVGRVNATVPNINASDNKKNWDEVLEEEIEDEEQEDGDQEDEDQEIEIEEDN